jgi:M6 family metalloprotease-like protein
MEVTLKKLSILLVLTALLFADKITIVRDQIQHIPQTPLPSGLTLVLAADDTSRTMAVQRWQPIEIFRQFPTRPLRTDQVPETLNVLVLRVEFVEDDDPATTGNGTMDYAGFGDPGDGLFYDPPHSKIYFERQMEFLSNFYRCNSFGNLVVTFTVKPDQPTECYQLPHKMRYYSGFDRYEESTGYVYYNTYAMDMGLVRILQDGVAAADADPSVDFSDYDEYLIFHAGTMLQTSLNFYRFLDIPSATIPPGALEFYLGIDYILANAGTDTIYGAGINSEMARVDEYMVGSLGTVCHEFGHTLGLPDLYDITGWSNGVGAWDLMGTGGWAGNPLAGAPEGSIPACLGAWSRYALGWVAPRMITDPDTLIPIRASEIDTTQFNVGDQTLVKIPISEDEFFLVENRQQDIKQKDTIIIDAEDGVPIYVDYGEYDFFLPGSGILIWHIDDRVIDSTLVYNTMQINPDHKGVDLEEADGIQHFDAWWYGDSIEYYGSLFDPFFVNDSLHANHAFGPFTNPNSDAYFGKSMININVLTAPDTIMDFAFDIGFNQHGFPKLVQGNSRIKQVSYGDLDGNGDVEIIVALERGSIYAYNHDGSLYGRYISYQDLFSYLAIGDISGDGADDIMFSTGFDIVCLDGRAAPDSTINALPGFSLHADNDIVSAPLLFDLNGDNTLELIVGSKDRYLYCVDETGTNYPNFPLSLNTELLSTPCVFDRTTHTIGVLGSDGRFWLIDESGIAKEFTDSQHNMLTFASPVVGDLDRDGQPEAVTINGFGTIYIYGADTLEQKFDILIDTTFYATPALADLDQDGYLEIIMLNSSRTLYATNRNGTSENNFPYYSDELLFYPLLVADLDTDGSQDITFGMGSSDSLGNGYLKLINDRNRESQFSPLFGEHGFSSPGVIVDVDNDGDMELATGSEYGKLYIWDFPCTTAAWQGIMNTPENSGLYEGYLPEVVTRSGILGNVYVYPSPVERNGIVRFFLNEQATVTVEIIDIVGHSIASGEMTEVTENEYNEVAFNFEKAANGVYVVRVVADNGSKREVKLKKFAVLK